MIKKLSLLVSACFLAAVVFAQSAPESNPADSPTKLFRYKLKLSPIKTEEELEALKNDKANASLVECSEFNFKPSIETSEEKVNKIIMDAEIYAKIHKEEGTNTVVSNLTEKTLLKSLSIDSASMEVLQNSTSNYSALIFGKDTLIGVKNLEVEGITFYFLRSGGVKYKCITEFGELIRLHNSQAMFAAGENLTEINGLTAKSYKTKMLNKGFITNSLLGNMEEVTNLVYNFQYPLNEKLLPLQFNLFKYDNKYCFKLKEFKTLPNSKAINKRLKRIDELKIERTSLNEFFEMVGFDY